MICTSLQHKSFDEIVSLLESGKVEMAEIRLDRCSLSIEEIQELFSFSDVPLIATCRIDEVMRSISRREAEVFALWVTGHGLKYIQETLFISESNAKTHMSNIYRKCDVHNRAEIIDLYERESS